MILPRFYLIKTLKHRNNLLKLMMATSITIESAVRGHHVLMRVWTPHAGETLLLRAEHGNTVNRFDITVVKGSNIVGHVPMEYSRVFWYFIAESSVRSADLDVRLK